jgi:hypothetical protein
MVERNLNPSDALVMFDLLRNGDIAEGVWGTRYGPPQPPWRGANGGWINEDFS